MKNSLWAIVVVVIGVVGFLVGYSVRSSPGSAVAAKGAGAAPHAEPAPGYGAQPAAAESAPGYGTKPAAAESAPGYGARPAATTAVPAGGHR